MKCLNCEIPMLKFNCSSGGVYYRCPQCRSIAESTVTDYSELSACQEPAKDELLEELKSELEHKKLAIKSRNVRIANLKNTLNGTYMSLERRKRKLSQARNIIKALCKYITPDSSWIKLERAEQVELLQQAEEFLKETEE